MSQESMSDSGYTHTFPAVRGAQAGRPFYIATCPLRIIPRIFVFDEEEVPPEMRAQRTLNRSRIPEMKSYLIENADNYIFSALTASVDARVVFTPNQESGPRANLGMLSIPMDARILINDGQHRRAAIEEAIKENPDLGHDNIAVVFFIDEGLERSQQMFADLNKHAIRPSASLGTLYDLRDPISELARFIAMTVEPFNRLTELEKSSISNRSSKLFTLSGIKQACRALLRKGLRDAITEEEKTLCANYWQEVAKHFPDWQHALERKVATADLREQFIHSHGIALHSLGVAGASLLSLHPNSWKPYLKKIERIDWARSNTTLWEGRAMMHGRISKARTNIVLTANVIKTAMELPLTDEEQALEDKIAS